MGRIGRSAVGILVGCLAWAPAAFATRIPMPGEGVPWVIESAAYAGELKEQIARMEARYTIRVLQDGWTDVPLAIQGAAVTEIAIEKKSGEAHIVPHGDSYVLAALRKGRYTVVVKFSHLLAQDSQFEGIQLGIPRATFSTMTFLVPRREVELRQADQLYVESQPDGPRNGVKLTARLGAANRIDLRWRTKPAAPVHVEPVLYGEVQTLVTVEEQLARVTSIIGYRIAQGQTNALLLHLPSDLNVLNVRGSGIDDWQVTEAAGKKTLRITLGVPLKETVYQLVVEGEQTIAAQHEAYTVPAIRLEGVQQERGYLAVSREGSIELSPQSVEGINRIDVKELPEALRRFAGSAVTLAFKYHQHPYRAVLTLTRHEDHPVLAAIAEQAELVTVLSQQGELLTRASYLIKANKKQFVEVTLPDGATLWSCLVNGKSVKPAQGTGKALLVPLDVMTDAADTVPVELVYFEQRPALVRIGQMSLHGPVLDVPTTVANWFLYAPHAIKFLRMSGNLERGAAAFEFLEEPFHQPLALAATPPMSGSPSSIEALLDDRSRQRDREARVGHNAATESDEGKGFSRTVAPKSMASFGRPDDPEQFEAAVGALADRLQETGILPLKVRLPKSGTVYRFNRLMTAQEPLTLEATFVHLRLPWVPVAALGFIFLPVGGLMAGRWLLG